MTKGTLIFRIIISVLLAFTMLFTAFFVVVFAAFVNKDVKSTESYLNVAGVNVTWKNREDILGDGTVSFDPKINVLTFNNAEIEYDYAVIYSKIDIMVELIGENKFVLSGDVVPAIHVSDFSLSKDILIFGEGSLTIDFTGTCTSALGIIAEDIRIETDVTINMPDCTDIANGIYSDASLTLTGGANVTVNNGAAAYSTAIKARNNIDVESGCTLNVSTRPGTTTLCRGVAVGGSLVVWDDAALNVSIDDADAKMSECINVPSLFSVGPNAQVSASAKKIYAIECYGSMELGSGASISAASEGEGVDLLCYGSIVNYGSLDGEVEAIGGVLNK